MEKQLPERRILWQHPLVAVEEQLSPTGERRLVVHRGQFVGVCLHLVAPEGKEAFLLVGQERPTLSALSWEHPAGMIDPGESPLQAALRELAEETGWLLLPEDLTPLHEAPLYPSPAFWNESGFFYGARLTVPAAVLEAYAQKPLRHTPTGEKLFLLTLPPDQILSTTQNLQTLAHTLLYYAHNGTPYRVLPSSPP